MTMNFKPGMNWHDMQTAAPIHEVLASASIASLTEIVVVGRAQNGEIVVISSHPNGDAVIGLLARGVHWLAEREQLVEQS